MHGRVIALNYNFNLNFNFILILRSAYLLHQLNAAWQSAQGGTTSARNWAGLGAAGIAENRI